MIGVGVYLIIGFLLSTSVERKPSDPLALFLGFFVVVFLWPYILWQSFRRSE